MKRMKDKLNAKLTEVAKRAAQASEESSEAAEKTDTEAAQKTDTEATQKTEMP